MTRGATGTAFIVDTDTPGFHVRWSTLRATTTATELQFDEMRVPKKIFAKQWELYGKVGLVDNAFLTLPGVLLVNKIKGGYSWAKAENFRFASCWKASHPMDDRRQRNRYHFARYCVLEAAGR